MPKAVRFEEYGGIDVLTLVEVDKPVAGPGEVVVRVEAAGINPGEASIRKGLLDAQFPTTFPSGQGSDYAGVVEEVGDGVTAVEVGDEVFGWTDERGSHAEYVKVPAGQAIPKPEGLETEVAGALYVAGGAAYGSVGAVRPTQGETVVVSGAAGGVGSIAAQLAALEGAAVIGIASEGNHDWLREIGVTPIAYGPGLADRIRAAAPDGMDAFIDTYGGGYVELAVTELKVDPARVNTTIDFEAVGKFGVKSEGTAVGGTAENLAVLADLIAAGKVEVPIAATYMLDAVHEAFADLEQRHTRGKIVLVP